mmetsp:Transcript_6452/g.5809  ORF Transcript_6452/g.5809 Transcript_6452/m.5809 type:complete len:80 (-) Transcript_6452:1964-2203(-)
MSKPFAFLSISISDCQEILGLNQYTPEEITDSIFKDYKTRPITREQFKETMRAAYERNVHPEKRIALPDVLNRVYDVCA